MLMQVQMRILLMAVHKKTKTKIIQNWFGLISNIRDNGIHQKIYL